MQVLLGEPCPREGAQGQCEQALGNGLVVRSVVYDDDPDSLESIASSCTLSGQTWTEL